MTVEVYKNFLPEEYNVQYRPALKIYKNKFDKKLIVKLFFYRLRIQFSTHFKRNRRNN